jgi:hypothetical protein
MSRPIPQTPAEHHARAVELANTAAELNPHSTSALVYATRAAAHASLALYKPTAQRAAKTTTKKETDE